MKEIKIILSDKLIKRLRSGVFARELTMQGGSISDQFVVKILDLLEEDVTEYTFKLNEEKTKGD